MAKKEWSCDEILKTLQAKQYSPIYFLMGEESYYIDLISDYIADNVLTDTEKEFNQLMMYGADTDVASVITAAKRYPMMADHQVIIVKEAQALSGNIDDLGYYLQKPLMSTILVLCHKYGALDRRKKLPALIEKAGVLFESKKIKDNQIAPFITAYLKRKGVDAEPKAAMMLAEFIGADLSRLTGELDKLTISLPQGVKRITPEQVEKNIGISKDYNNFELKNALISKDVLKAYRIIKYYEENPKKNPIQLVLASLFSFYSNLMLAYYAPEKTEQGVAAWLGLKSAWGAKDYLTAMRQYNGVKTMQIIGEIRNADARSKGVGNVSTDTGDIMRELLFKILN